ncbi:MAG: diguanylate cyclase [Clostridiaceae bacterium]|nr:diguanylate cyclase [Clostridiaceae bacterium]
MKKINDNYGHTEGDYTIKKIARELRTSVRSSDIVCRYGGDEFLIIPLSFSHDGITAML